MSKYCAQSTCWNHLPCATHGHGQGQEQVAQGPGQGDAFSLPSTMKAATYEEFSTDNKNFPTIALNQIPVPRVVAGEVLVRVVRAASNPVDVKVLNGILKSAWGHPLPFTAGYDFSGTVAALGEHVDSFKIGEDVWAVNWGHGTHWKIGGKHVPGGAFAEYIRVEAKQLSHKPRDVPHEIAAALALVGTTALQALRELGDSLSGKKLLILGGSSAVGFQAIQLAKLQGAEVTTTASSRAHEFVQQTNPDKIIDYTKTNWWETAETVYDYILDTVGEKDTLERAKKVLKKADEGGAFVSIVDFSIGPDPSAHAPYNAHVFCLSNSSTVQDELIRLVQQKKLIVPIDSSFPFTTEGVRDLLRKQEQGKSLGKNILNVA